MPIFKYFERKFYCNVGGREYPLLFHAILSNICLIFGTRFVNYERNLKEFPIKLQET